MFKALLGTDLRDILRGTNRNDDFIFGRDGDDELNGRGGDDFIFGADGADLLRGGRGGDVLAGGAGADDLRGGLGRDLLLGGSGDDQLAGGRGADDLRGGVGADAINGGRGSDVITGGEGSDVIVTGRGRDVVRLTDNQLAGEDAEPGVRGVVGGEDDMVDFDLARDTLSIDAEAFGVAGPLSFQNALAETLVDDGSNVIVLQDADDDGDPSTVFNAGSAANLIANAVDTSGSGFFVYFNSALDMNRLVFSQDLGDASADLQIVTRFSDLTGQAAIDALAGFDAGNFAFENEQPASDALLL